MSDDLVDLLDHLKTKTKSFETDHTALKILASLSSHQAKHTGGMSDYDLEDPDDYDLNRSIGTFLADRTDTLTYAKPFLIKAVNENRDDEHRLPLLRAMAKVFESIGDIERECLVLQPADQHSY